MDPDLMKRLTIALSIMIVSAMLILSRVQHSSVFKSVERQVEFEQQMKSGAAYSNDPEVHFHDGMLYLSAGNYDDAEMSFKQAIEFKPDWPEAHYQLGVVYAKLGRRDKAKEEYVALRKFNKEMAEKLLGEL